MKSDIEAIRGRLEKATPGPWISNEWSIDDIGCVGYEVVALSGDAEEKRFAGVDPYTNRVELLSKENAEFIAHAPTDIATLLRELEQNDKQIEHMEFLLGEANMKVKEYERLPTVECQAENIQLREQLQKSIDRELEMEKELTVKDKQIQGMRCCYNCKLGNGHYARMSQTCNECLVQDNWVWEG
jgi:hypothetical protein